MNYWEVKNLKKIEKLAAKELRIIDRRPLTPFAKGQILTVKTSEIEGEFKVVDVKHDQNMGKTEVKLERIGHPLRVEKVAKKRKTD